MSKQDEEIDFDDFLSEEDEDEDEDEDDDDEIIDNALAIVKQKDDVAKLLGYGNFNEALDAHTKQKLEASGIDEDGYKAVMDVVRSTSEYQAFIAYMEQNKFTADLQTFNTKHKTAFTNNNITKEVCAIIEKGGLTFEQAMLAKYPGSSKKSSSTGKEHLKVHNSSGTGGKTTGDLSRIDKTNLSFFKSVNPDSTPEQQKDFLRKVRR